MAVSGVLTPMGNDVPRFRLTSDAIAVARGEFLRRALRRATMGALLLAAVAAITSEAFVMSHFPFFWTTIACLGVAAIGGFALLLFGPLFGRARSGVIEIGDDAIVLRRGSEQRNYRLESLEQGAFREPDGLLLRFRDGTEVAARATRSEATALLNLVSLSPHQRVLRVPLASAASQRFGGEVLGVLGVLFVGGTTFLSTALLGAAAVFLSKVPHFPPQRWETKHSLIVLSAMLAAVAGGVAVRTLHRFLERREAVVGADGVTIEIRGSRAFIPYGDVAHVLRTERGVALGLQDGSSLELPIQARIHSPLPVAAEPAAAGIDAGDALHRREVLFERISAAVASNAACESAVHIDALDQKGLSVDAWREELRTLLSRVASYRDPHLTAEELFAIAADGHAPPDRRIAAAVALSSADDEELRRRIRIAVDASADEDLRAAIEQAAEGDLDEPTLDRVRQRARPDRHRPTRAR
jgi:hypothetical protein